ncbi:hypothetical protein [Taklimakanibacter lacteus]|uniref:hypothetical protein n=1 Tax=Taklimakanibacter lacteus TaxID=2268456 RepID=UPI000E66D045
MIAHIAKRIGLIMVGYAAAMVVSALPVWRVTLVTGPTAYYWTSEGHIVGPEYTALIFSLTEMLIYPFLPALAFISAAETFRWRRLWIYLIGWVLVLAVSILLMSPPYSPLAMVVAYLSVLVGGLIYWAIAGRQAGWSMRSIAA